MEQNTSQKAVAFLQALVNQPLCYGLKAPDMDLYDFGFGKLVEVMSWRKEKKEICTYTLHITCRFKVICKKGERRIDKYYEDTPNEVFNSNIKCLLGLCVKRVALSDKNDLWLDFGDYWVVFVTYEDGEESWRFFTLDNNMPHLVASNLWINF